MPSGNCNQIGTVKERMLVTFRLVGEVDSVGSSSTSSGVQAELRQAVQLALEQQQQLEALRDIIEQQNKYINRLCRRDVTLGLELRQTGIQDKPAASGDSRVTSTLPAGEHCLYLCVPRMFTALLVIRC